MTNAEKLAGAIRCLHWTQWNPHVRFDAARYQMGISHIAWRLVVDTPVWKEVHADLDYDRDHLDTHRLYEDHAIATWLGMDVPQYVKLIYHGPRHVCATQAEAIEALERAMRGDDPWAHMNANAA